MPVAVLGPVWVIRPASWIRLDVGGERQGDDVGLEAVDDVLGLGRAAAEGLWKITCWPSCSVLPLRLEVGDELAVDVESVLYAASVMTGVRRRAGASGVPARRCRPRDRAAGGRAARPRNGDAATREPKACATPFDRPRCEAAGRTVLGLRWSGQPKGMCSTRCRPVGRSLRSRPSVSGGPVIACTRPYGFSPSGPGSVKHRKVLRSRLICFFSV